MAGEPDQAANPGVPVRHQPSDPSAPDSLNELIGPLRQLIGEARSRALRAVDEIQVRTCWQIGRHIVEFEQGGEARAAYGKRLLPALAERLTAEFGKGFDASNLRNMRLFYQVFPNCDALRHELSWTHYRLLSRVESEEARLWYMAEAAARNMYVRMYDDLKRNEGDNPTVGILLCAAKDQSVVRYSVLHESEQMFASRYKLVLPSEEELRAELARDAEVIRQALHLEKPEADDGENG